MFVKVEFSIAFEAVADYVSDAARLPPQVVKPLSLRGVFPSNVYVRSIVFFLRYLFYTDSTAKMGLH